jgi:hypothetical protein
MNYLLFNICKIRISGLSYLEARPPPTVYMPDDDDESSIKNVMMLVDRPQSDNIQQVYILLSFKNYLFIK